VGAVTFSLDPRLVAALQSALPLRILVETGTHNGDTVSLFKQNFEKIVSIELSEVLYLNALNRFAQDSHVELIQGNSVDELKNLQSEIRDKEVLYWLDAHWCVAAATSGELSQCPLLGELAAIGKLNMESVVLIDDARLFLAPPLAPHETSQWPSMREIFLALQALSPHHDFIVINDILAFYPCAAKAAVTDYARSFGIDWLKAAELFKENKPLVAQLEEKELCINLQHERLLELSLSLKEKELKIQEQHRSIIASSSGCRILPKVFAKGILQLRRIRGVFLPRLGNLKQYRPRLLTQLEPVKPGKKGALLRISIVTPSYAQGHFIRQTLRSVLDQRYPALEYFVQDAGSLDSTVEVLKNFQHALTGWESEKDNGQSHAINRGFAKTSGEIMAWLNSDDLLLPGAIQTVANFFKKHPDVDVVYGNRLLIDENDMEIGRWIMPGHDSSVLSWVDYVPQETLFWRRRIWDKVGGQIDETFRFAMDWDLILRFRDAGAKFAHIPRFLGAFRIHSQQKTSTQINQVGLAEMDRIRARYLGRIPTRQEVRKAIIPFLLRHLLVDLKYCISVRLQGFK
jgi:GT2 family glycosyltransferase